MEIKTFWIIVIKAIGLWLLMTCLYIIPQFFSALYTIQEIDDNVMLTWTGLAFITFGYIALIYIFIFKAPLIVNVLKLDRNFIDKKLEITTSSKLLTMTVVVIGAIVFLESVPSLCQELFVFFQQRTLIKEYANTSWLLYHFIRAVTGYIIMTNSNHIVRFIENKVPKN